MVFGLAQRFEIIGKSLQKLFKNFFIINFTMSLIAYVALFGAIALVPRLQQDKSLFLIVSLNNSV